MATFVLWLRMATAPSSPPPPAAPEAASSILASEQTVEPGVVRRHATCRVAQAQASVPHTLALTPLAPCTCRLMGLGVLLGLTGSVLINVGNNVQALGTELL